jgi:hypothetical protein
MYPSPFVSYEIQIGPAREYLNDQKPSTPAGMDTPAAVIPEAEQRERKFLRLWSQRSGVR